LIYGNDLDISNNVTRKANILPSKTGTRDETKQASSSSSDSISKIKIANDVICITVKTEATKISEIEKVIKNEPVADKPTTSSASTTKKSASNNSIATMFSKQKEQQAKNPIKEEVVEKIVEKKTAAAAKETKVIKTKSPANKKKERKDISKKVLGNLKKEFDDDVEMLDDDEVEKEYVFTFLF
jgi:hypothetical protein